MYRSLLRFNHICVDGNYIKLHRYNVIRHLSTQDDPNNSDDIGAKENKVKRNKTFNKSKSELSITQNEQLAKGQKDSNKKLDGLLENVKKFQSIGPNDQGTISQKIGKPKTFIRQSARQTSQTTKSNEKETEPINVLARGLDKRLVQAAQRVARRMPKNLAKATENELLESIQRQKAATLEAKKKYQSREQAQEDYSKSISYQIMMENKQSFKSPSYGDNDDYIGSTEVKIKLNENRPFNQNFRRDANLFAGGCLNVFNPKGSYLNSDENRTLFWEKLTNKEIELSADFPAENFFEEMVRLTEEGKLWKYPINNEQGLEEEEDVPFYEHVLLDNLLEEFPDHGPVRQFMELVVMGLSQNPYISVERKRESVDYYKNFFADKQLLDQPIEEEVCRT